MAVSKIKVNTVSLDRTRSDLQDRLDKIKSSVEKITDDMHYLNTMWVGDDHEAFEAIVNADLAVLSEVCGGIQGIISYESNAVKEYDMCERKVADLIARIHV